MGLFLELMMIDQKTCMHFLSYDAETGEFRRKFHRQGHALKDVAPGSIDSKGYRQILVNGRQYLAHRLAWVIVHGYWPDFDIDHIDRNPANNAISNLRRCTHAENLQNVGVRSDSTSGVAGVSWTKSSKKWLAYINLNGRRIRLGLFAQFEDAVRARGDAVKKYHPFAPRVVLGGES